jgi:Protein tyrosine and serine/threonine kinase
MVVCLNLCQAVRSCHAGEQPMVSPSLSSGSNEKHRFQPFGKGIHTDGFASTLSEAITNDVGLSCMEDLETSIHGCSHGPMATHSSLSVPMGHKMGPSSSMSCCSEGSGQHDCLEGQLERTEHLSPTSSSLGKLPVKQRHYPRQVQLLFHDEGEWEGPPLYTSSNSNPKRTGIARVSPLADMESVQATTPLGELQWTKNDNDIDGSEGWNGAHGNGSEWVKEENRTGGNDEDVLQGYDEDGEFWDLDGCTPTEDWMNRASPHKVFFSTCGLIHEFDSSLWSLVHCGASRCAFEARDATGKAVAVKVSMYNNVDYVQDYSHREAGKETFVMERLSWSPHIVDIYANCATSQITEFADGGNLLDLINVARNHPEQSQLSPDVKLKLAYHVMSAAADMHQFEPGNTVYPYLMSHDDMFVHQFLLVNGVLKLNDFTFSSFPCKVDIDEEDLMNDVAFGNDAHAKLLVAWPPTGLPDSMDKAKAPEELLWELTRQDIYRDRVDVWYAGEALYHLLTNRWMFEEFGLAGARYAIVTDKTMDILLPEEDREQFSHPAEQVIIEAIKLAWEFVPSKRPSARELANFLKQELDALCMSDERFCSVEGGSGGTFRVRLPPRPAEYQTTEQEFDDVLACPMNDVICIEDNRREWELWAISATG